jgi:hypothetical protein
MLGTCEGHRRCRPSTKAAAPAPAFCTEEMRGGGTDVSDRQCRAAPPPIALLPTPLTPPPPLSLSLPLSSSPPRSSPRVPSPVLPFSTVRDHRTTRVRPSLQLRHFLLAVGRERRSSLESRAQRKGGGGTARGTRESTSRTQQNPTADNWPRLPRSFLGAGLVGSPCSPLKLSLWGVAPKTRPSSCVEARSPARL